MLSFIRATQAKEWARLEKLHGARTGEQILADLCKWMDAHGSLATLRHGFKCYGRQLKAAFFKAAHELNLEVEARYAANMLGITRQLRFSPRSEKSLDVVLSLNGIPVATVELKNRFTGQTVDDAVLQYRRSRDPTEPIFEFQRRTLVHFAVDTESVRMTTRLAGKATDFLPFNKGCDGGAGNPPDPDGRSYRTAYLWEDVLERRSLLDILARFIHLQTAEKRDERGRKAKTETMIFPRYHQLEAVRLLEAAARDAGTGNNYLVEHSAGSGKSNTIGWLAHRLSSLHSRDNERVFDSVIVVTDRVVLDQQLQETIYEFEHKRGVVQKIDKDSRQLAEALEKAVPIVITTMQKFPFVSRQLLRMAEERGTDPAGALPTRRCAVIIDEAHSSQGGAARGARVLEHAVFAMVANRLVAPCSKRRLTEWAESDVVMPEWWSAPSADQYYRALDAVAGAKDATEQHLYSRLCDLANLDLRLVCYDLTSTYFEAPAQPSGRFPSRAFGYSRDHRGDRPQIVIGLLCTADGIPIAHHVFAGDTNDASTLPGVLADLSRRFAVGGICVVADRGLISTDNVEAVAAAGFGHVLATRLRRDHTTAEALGAIDDDTAWAEVEQHRCRATDMALADGTRAIVVESAARARRDDARRAEIVAAAEAELLALERRVRAGRLKDPAKIGRAAQRILNNSGAGRLFDLDISEGRFLYHYNDHAMQYEQLLAGRYVVTTSLTPTQASAAQVVAAYRQLAAVEARFRVLKDFLHLRPVRHWTEQRVRGHIAICVYAAVIETLINQDLAKADIRDPDLADQHLTAARALRELNRIRRHHLTANGRRIQLTTRRTPLQARALSAIGAHTHNWDKADIT